MNRIKIKNFILIIFAISTTTVFASSTTSDHHPSVSDLMWPAVNFIILFSFLFYKLKNPINDMFVNKARNIEELYYSAGKKDKESQKRLDGINQKFKELGFLREDIMKKTQSDLINLKEVSVEDIASHKEKQINDLQSKIINERQKSSIYLEKKLISVVLDQVKTIVTNDQNLKEKITNKLLNQLT